MQEEPLTKSDYDYILASLKHARYAIEGTPYPTNELKRKQLANLDYIEEKLKMLRAAIEE
jgi:hypothetical protein